MTEILQVRFGGWGGQGVLLMGAILGDAAVRDGLWAAGSDSYGAQARGSACCAEVVLADEPVDFPHVLRADLLVVMSQESYEAFLPEMGEGGVVIRDDRGVTPRAAAVQLHVPIPAADTASRELVNAQVANVVLLAATVALTGVVSTGALRDALGERVPHSMREINREALERGFALGKDALEHVGRRPLVFRPRKQSMA